MGPTAHIIMDFVGWRKAMMILAAVNLVFGFLGCPISRKTLIVDKNDEKTNHQGLKKTFKSAYYSTVKYFSSLKNPKLVLILAISVPFYFGMFLPTLHLV